MSDQTVTAGSLPASSSEGWVHWARVAASAAADRLGRDATIIDVGDVISITDYFVIASGNTPRQVRAIVEEVEEQLMILDGPKSLRVEGRDDHRWVLIDFGGFVVHVLDEESRAFYDLERLWSDCPRIAWAPPEGAQLDEYPEG